jgi:hypothetical protein
VRLGDEVGCGRVGRDGADGDDEVAELHVRLEAAACPHANDPLHAEHRQLLDHDRGRGTTHAARLNGHRAVVERAGEAEHAALAVDLARLREERLGDVLRAQRVARE